MSLKQKILGDVQVLVDSDPAYGIVSPGSVAVTGKMIGSDEACAMVEAVLDGFLTAGRFNDAFESELKSFIGAKHVLTVNSGSSANLVAFSALTSPKLGESRIMRGDEVITPAAGFPTTVNPIIQNGAIPVFVDIDLNTLNMNLDAMERAVSERTRAVMFAHTLGNPAQMDRVKRFTEKHNLWLVEDCCDSLGSRFNDQHVGTFGDVGTLSFYPAHHITTGEGGAVFTNSGKLKPILESFRDWGRDCFCPPGKDNTCGKRFCWKLGSLPPGYDHKYIYSNIGYNLKMTDVQAACGLAQIKKLKNFCESRRENFAILLGRLRKYSEHLLFVSEEAGARASWFGFPIMVKPESKISREMLQKHFEEEGVGYRYLFAGNLIRQPAYASVDHRVHGTLTNSDYVLENLIWVGVHPLITSDCINRIVDCVDRTVNLTTE